MRDLSLHLMDIVENSITAGASVVNIDYMASFSADRLTIIISDNGKGMTKEQLQNVVNPFFTTRTTRDVGLGIPLLKMSAEQTGGNFKITSAPGKGTCIKASFCTNHIDMLPFGDTASSVYLLIVGNPDIDFIFSYQSDNGCFNIDTTELRQALEGVPFNEPSISKWIEDFIRQGLLSVS